MVLTLLVAMAVLPSRAYAAGTATATSGATITFDSGTLDLVTVPSLDFGTWDLSAATETYTGAVVNSTPIQVLDLTGTGGGWAVQVQLGEFTGKNKSGTLTGASLGLTIAAVSTDASVPTDASVAGQPVGTAITLTAGSVSSKTILTAGAGKGMGVWNAALAAPTLTVFPGALADSYTATLTWGFVDAS
jgi:hypothetical protein